MFNSLLSLLFVFCFSAIALANEASLQAWQDATVKIRSYPCTSGRPVLEGSGILVKDESGRIAVWTSEHVLIHSQLPTYCHEVSHSGARSLARLQKVSFLSGVAVLTLPENENTISKKALSLNSKTSSAPAQSLVALGYPQGSVSLQTLTDGKAVSLQSQRAQIPSVQFTIEALQLPVEYGMSGGALLAKNENGMYSLVGLLSHQVLKRRPSQGTVSESLTAGDLGHPTDLALAVPTSEILRWLKTATEVETLRDPIAQLRGEEVIQSGALSFKMKQGSLEDLFGIGGLRHGGADGSGIGGADGTGIGGNTLFPSSGESFNSVEVFFSNTVGAEQKSLPFKNVSLESWRQQLLRGQKVSVPYFRVSSEARLQGVNSLSQFFKLLLQEGAEPVGILSRNDSQSSDFSTELKNIALKAQSIRESSQNVMLVTWLGWVRDQALLAQSGLLTSQQLLHLLEETPDLAWQEFYTTNFDAAVALNSHIQKAATMMKARGL